jgi:hypothetical protein
LMSRASDTVVDVRRDPLAEGVGIKDASEKYVGQGWLYAGPDIVSVLTTLVS